MKSNQTVWKFTLRPHEPLDMPQGAQVLHVAEQRGEMCLWALCNYDAGHPKERRLFHVIGTGHHLPEGLPLEHVGSLLMSGGALVFHVFEQTYPNE